MNLSTDPYATVPADCHADCLHYRPVTGACGHDLKQTLVADFLAHPAESCPLYSEGEK
jgi:hypothetical protein